MALLMKAKEAADQVYDSIRTKVEEMKRKGLHPHMAAVLVEGDPASSYYARAKQKTAGKLGVAFSLHSFPADVTEDKILRLISRLNDDPAVHGIMLFLVGRGQTVGLPLFHLLQRENATVTVCHSRTPDIAFHLGHAEIAFVAVGRPNIVTSDMVHASLTIIDAGINETADGKIAGDVSPDAVLHAAALSPVPGGVGTLTTAILFENLMEAITLQLEEATGE